MMTAKDFFYQVRTFSQAVRVMYLYGDLLYLAGQCVSTRKTVKKHAKGYVYVCIEVARSQFTYCLGEDSFRFQYTHNLQPLVFNLYHLPHSLFLLKKLAGDSRSQHTDLLFGIMMHLGEEITPFYGVIQYVIEFMGYSNDGRAHRAVSKTHIGCDFRLRGYTAYLWHNFPYHFGIAQRKSRRELGPYLVQFLISHVLFADDDVVYSQILVFGYRLTLGALAYGKHGYDRRHTKNYTQHGKERAKLMIGKSL